MSTLLIMVYKASRNIEKDVKVGIVKNHITSHGLLRHNINPNNVHQESINCNTSHPENVAKTRDQSVLSDLSDSDFYSDNDEVLCTTEKQSDGNGE